MASCLFVSACLLGIGTKWNSRPADSIASVLARFMSAGGKIISLCPECAGGLSTPRQPCEIRWGVGKDVTEGRAKVISAQGRDCTFEYLSGAREALALCLANKVSVAVLKSGSPSCGVSEIFDGTFSGKRISGDGVTASLFKQAGIDVYDENHVIEALAQLQKRSAAGCPVCGEKTCLCNRFF